MKLNIPEERISHAAKLLLTDMRRYLNRETVEAIEEEYVASMYAFLTADTAIRGMEKSGALKQFPFHLVNTIGNDEVGYEVNDVLPTTPMSPLILLPHDAHDVGGITEGIRYFVMKRLFFGSGVSGSYELVYTPEVIDILIPAYRSNGERHERPLFEIKLQPVKRRATP